MSKSRNGFTVIELLIVIAIIAVIVSLTIPAVQAAREAARRTQCINHLKQLALACLNHESAVKFLPTAGWNPLTVGHPDAGTGVTQPGGWLYNILPYLEQAGLYKNQAGLTGAALKSAALTVIQTPLAVMYCPSRRPVQLYPDVADKYNNAASTMAVVQSLFGSQDAVMVYDASATTLSATAMTNFHACAHSDYAGNGYAYQDYDFQGPSPANDWINALIAGGSYKAAQWLQSPAAAGSATTNLDRLRAQLSQTPAGEHGLFCYCYTIALSDITDGVSNTYLCGEKYVNTGNYLTGLDYGDDWCDYNGYDPDNIRFCDPVAGPPHEDEPGPLDSIFGSAHPSACNMAFCDGSVHSISYGISATLHDQLGNRNDGAALDLTQLNL